MELDVYEKFLESLELNPDFSMLKTVEMDLKGELNPTEELNRLFYDENKWLNLEDFFDHYLQINKDVLKKRICSLKWEEFEKGLKARIYRTQVGLLTEYHAFFMAKKVFGEEKVKRCVGLDRLGVDFQIFHNNDIYNIHIFVDTPRSWGYRDFKSTHKNVEGVGGFHINLPYSLSEGKINSLRKLKNGFGVYTEEYIEYLKREIDKGDIKNREIIGVASCFIYRSSQ